MKIRRRNHKTGKVYEYDLADKIRMHVIIDWKTKDKFTRDCEYLGITRHEFLTALIENDDEIVKNLKAKIDKAALNAKTNEVIKPKEAVIKPKKQLCGRKHVVYDDETVERLKNEPLKEYANKDKDVNPNRDIAPITEEGARELWGAVVRQTVADACLPEPRKENYAKVTNYINEYKHWKKNRKTALEFLSDKEGNLRKTGLNPNYLISRYCRERGIEKPKLTWLEKWRLKDYERD